MQHVDIALTRYLQLGGQPVDHEPTPIFNVRGYGIVAGTLSWVWWQLSGDLPTVSSTILLLRQLSVVFALALIVLVFLLARRFGLPPPAAAFAALLLACCDLNISYSHYGLPEIGYVLGIYTTIYGGLLHDDRRRTGLAVMALGAGLSLAFKFDFLPLLAALLFLTVQRQWLAALLLPAGAALAFGLITGFSWPPDLILDSWRQLREANQDVIGIDRHWLYNPLLYTAAVVAGIGIPAVALAGYGLLRLPRRLPPGLWLLIGLLLLEFGLRWAIDTPFVRRANEFMPAVCLAAALGWQQTGRSLRIALPVAAWTLALGLLGQSNHWFDTREKARDWVNTHLPDSAVVVATPYVEVAGLRPVRQYRPGEQWDYAILHETFYSRYGYSLTTPFGYPECCAGVYHCRSEAECREIQDLLQERNNNAELIARFDTRNWLPERWLYDHWFGYYETFLGDVLVYRRTADKS